ncbi:putative integral membrane family protein [Botrytis cinerea BcDW1]|uniref:Putative integral membrane family protein n=1 Tax=Botryotinia fuckeliana (strain BcDW1) TaxID=1290391 RepID=M7TLC9_BOTF1|nr:putative integral membrane family protein [Botrytis cinerea BcDW1]
MDGRQIQIITVVTVGLFFSLLSVGLRCYTRIFVSRTFGSDDYWILLGLVAYTVTSALSYLGVHYGIGVHATQLTYDQLIGAAKCRPLKASWDPLTPGVCLEPRIIANFAYAISAETIFFDWLFALLPIPMLWDIKMSLRLKFSIMFILGLGIVASIATIIRLKYLVAFLNVTDSLYSIAPVFVWSTIEIALGIVAASTATLRPLLRSWKILGFSSDGSSDTEPGGPRSGSWSGFKKTPFGPSNRTATHLSNELSLGDTIHAQSPNLKTVKSWSGKSGHSEERILGEASGRSAGNERGLEGENEEYELVSMPDGRILRRTEIQIEYDERRKNLETDMV